MTCPKCQHQNTKKSGTYGNGNFQRYRCADCSRTFSVRPPRVLGSHTTTMDDAAKVFMLMLEGMSIRGISRVTGIHKNTILRMLLTVGEKCKHVFDQRVQNVSPRFVQADELWAFVQKKNRRVRATDPTTFGDTFIWVAIDSETKAVLSFHIGRRDNVNAKRFIWDLAQRTTGRFQLTTDGMDGYIDAVERAFGADIDYAQMIKTYSQAQATGPDWFRPSRIVTVRPEPVTGNPDHSRISTSHIERFNLSIRMHLRRFTRLTNAFSRSLEHMQAAVALFMAFYNFCRSHQTLRVTPAMEAGLTDHIWSISELLGAAV